MQLPGYTITPGEAALPLELYLSFGNGIAIDHHLQLLKLQFGPKIDALLLHVCALGGWQRGFPGTVHYLILSRALLLLLNG